MMARKTARGTARESGITLLELLVVVAIVGILAGIAIPAIRYALLRARARAIGGDLKVVELAIHQHVADRGTVPTESGTGVQPTTLTPYLGRKIAWDNQRRGYKLDWENWVNPNGTPRRASTGVMLGISVVTRDKELATLLLKDGPPPMVPTTADKYTYVIRPVR